MRCQQLAWCYAEKADVQCPAFSVAVNISRTQSISLRASHGVETGDSSPRLASLRRFGSCGKLVSIRISTISNKGSVRTLCGRALDRGTTMRDAGLMPGENIVAARCGDTDSPAVGYGCRLAIDGFRDHQPTTLVGVDQPASGVHLAGLAPQRGKGGILEAPGLLQGVAADHDVGEHAFSPERGSTR